MFNLFGQNGGNGRCFQSVSYSFSSSNGNVNHFYQTTTQAPGQDPVINTYTTSGNMVSPVDNLFAQNSLFGSSLFNNFFNSQNFVSQQQQPQPQINGVEDSQMNEYDGPEIEDISDYLEGENFSSPSKVEEVEEDYVTEEELRRIQEMEYQESLLRDQMKTKLYEGEEDDDFERVKEVETCDIDVINSNTAHYPNSNNNNIADNDVIGDDDENNELRELIRESYLSLSYPLDDQSSSPIDSCTILVQLPNGKRVERKFNVQDTTWANVKTWVSFEMAKDKDIPTEEFPLESEFEICINYPFIILTSGVNVEKKLCEFRREIGRKALIYIRKND